MGFKFLRSWRPYPMKTKIPICRTIFGFSSKTSFFVWLDALSDTLLGIFQGNEKRKNNVRTKENKKKEKRKKEKEIKERKKKYKLEKKKEKREKKKGT